MPDATALNPELRIEPAAHVASWDTALLGLDVKAESSEPALELSAGAGRFSLALFGQAHPRVM